MRGIGGFRLGIVGSIDTEPGGLDCVLPGSAPHAALERGRLETVGEVPIYRHLRRMGTAGQLKATGGPEAALPHNSVTQGAQPLDGRQWGRSANTIAFAPVSPT